ncbi:MAG: type II toxin-antitoxin system RelE/ParE family toxin [Betaproteobacteria bacterium]|nr:type II toxin-antitoxin system RelE/ParE family toxin [Betaproteobacteria bacterium]
MGSFTLTQKARDDMLSIGWYTRKKWGKVQQTRYLIQLDTAFHDLADNPHVGRVCNDIREGYYKFGIGKHLIFYRHKGKDQIEIVRILHGRMDIEQHL